MTCRYLADEIVFTELAAVWQEAGKSAIGLTVGLLVACRGGRA